MLFLRLSLFAALLALTSCVYFNTYYNAQKSFAQAEKERRKFESEKFDLDETLQPGRSERSQQADQLYDQAARRASRVLDKYKESDLVDDAMFILGRAFYWQGQYLSAVKSLRDLELNFPESEYYDRARYWRGLSFEAQGVESEAVPVYQALFQEAEVGLAARAGLRLGEMAFARDAYAEAVQEYRTVLDRYPDTGESARLWLRLGEALMALEDSTRYGETLEAFARVLEHGPDREVEYRAHLNRGRVLYARGDVEGALKVYMNLLREGRFRAFEGKTRLLIGQYYQERGLLEQAVGEFEQVRDDFPQTASSAMALYRTGLLHLQEKGEVELASEYFQEVSREKPGAEATVLAQQMLGHLQQLEGIRTRIHQADSLATDSLRALAGPDSLGAEAEPDSLSALPWIQARTPQVLQDLFAGAELYRDHIGQADSAIAYYEEIIRRFPESEQVPRAIYSIAWIHLEEGGDEGGAEPYLRRLIEEFSASPHANAARSRLGLETRVTAEEEAAAHFARIETLRLRDVRALEAYVPLLDTLSQNYAGTRIGAKAAYVAAVSYENVRGDSLEAERRFERLAEDFAGTLYADLAARRREMRESGLVAKLERSIKSVGGQLRPGEQIEVLALEPDSLDSVSLARKYYGFALRAQRRGELKQARTFYERSLEEQGRNADIIYQLGNIDWEQGYVEDAVERYREVLGLSPGFVRSQYRMFNYFVAEGRADSANYYLREIAKRDRGNPEIRYLVEEYPDLTSPETPEDLDLDLLEELSIAPPEEDLSLPRRELPIGDFPLVRRLVQPAFPAGVAGDSAAVIVDVLIGPEGRAEKVDVFSGEEALRKAAIEAAYEYIFYPAVHRNGEQVRVWVELVVPFARQRLPASTSLLDADAAEEQIQ